MAVELSGFKTFVTSGNVLVADGRLTVDPTLEAGEVSETVTVTAQAGETVNTTSGEIARVVDGEQVQSLALNGRNFLQLATLVPGAPLLDFDAIAQTTGGGGTIAVNGSRSDSNNLTVDGGFNLLKANNSVPGNNVGVDFIQEVKIQTSNFSAEHGRQSGAAINVTTRSGGNQLRAQPVRVSAQRQIGRAQLLCDRRAQAALQRLRLQRRRRHQEEQVLLLRRTGVEVHPPHAGSSPAHLADTGRPARRFLVPSARG